MTRHLNATDVLLILFAAFLSLLSIALGPSVSRGWLLTGLNLAAVGYVWLLALWSRRTRIAPVRWLHDWNAIPVILFFFKEVNSLILSFNRGEDFDWLFIRIDRFFFRVNPTEWLAGFANPYVTEILQVAYSLFYLFFVVVGLELYLRKGSDLFSRFRFAVTYGFFLSYLGYLLLPAVGPRFTLHDYARIESELPGVVVTPFLRRFVDSGDSIPVGASNSVAMASAQRDAFPSGHTMLTLVVIISSFRWRAKSRFAVLLVGALLILGTVYLRYHYVIDVVAGALLGIACLRTVSGIHEKIRLWLPELHD